MRILVLGAGAIGGYFGGRLAASGADVSFLVRGARAAQLAGGLRIESPMGDVSTPVRMVQAGDDLSGFDVILLACKAYGLSGALDAVAPAAGRGTVLVPLLNGLAHLDAIAARFPGVPVLAGSVLCGATLLPDGTVRHLGPPHVMTVGLRPGQEAIAPVAARLCDAVRSAGVDAVLHEDILQALWDKWVFLVTLAATTCLMRGTVGQILATDHGATAIMDTFEEAMAVATAEGHLPAGERLEQYRGFLTDRGSEMSASMLRDLRQGGPTEADHVIGDMTRRARRHGIATPNLDRALTHMQVYEAGRS